MGRPLKSQNIEREKELTFAICSQIKAGSGLSFSKLEQAISEAMSEALKVGDGGGRVFSRYCDKAPEKRHMASRDKLAAWLRLALKNGWVERDFAKQYRVWIGDPSHPAPSEIAERKHDLQREVRSAGQAALDAIFHLFKVAVEYKNEVKITVADGREVFTSAGEDRGYTTEDRDLSVLNLEQSWLEKISFDIHLEIAAMENDLRKERQIKKPTDLTLARIRNLEGSIQRLRKKQDELDSAPDLKRLVAIADRILCVHAEYKYDYLKEASPPAPIDTSEADKLIAEMELILANHKSVDDGNSTSQSGAKVVQLKRQN